MNVFAEALGITASGLEAQSRRMRHIAENIANIDTPGYRRKTVAFDAAGGRDAPAEVRTGPTRLDRSALARVHDPGHPLADASGHYDGSNVDLMIEIADAREAGRSYEANLKMFEQTREMSRGLMDLLRR